jgi:2-(1,2-epoxy-1,2-dihydrophenyl)acetyl-CoA isomerase
VTEVRCRRDGDVAVVTLNRAHALNAINVGLLAGLVAALRDSRGARCVVLEGEGRAFCVGEDLKETLAPRTGGPDEWRSSFEALQELTRAITSMPAPVIAAVHGYAIGGGAELALATDLVVAGPEARFRFPEVSLGHAVTGGISARLPAIVGLLRAKEYLLTGRWIEADEAARVGLVNELAGDPRRRARELAAELAASSPRSMGVTKRSLELAAVPHQEAVLAHEVHAASYCFAADEASASIAAFRDAHPS